MTLHHDADQPSPTANPAEPPAGYGRHKGLVFATVSVALFMVAVDQTIVATALPSIQHELHTRITWAGWTITTYSLAQVLAMPVAGRLSDQFGRKTIFMCAAAVFTVASLCCGLSNSIYLLIALRGAQALGGGAFMPSASGIVADQFGPDRDRALAMFTSILPIGGIVGPVLGGVFVTDWSWRWIFLINVPIGVMLIILCALLIPRSTRRSRVPADVSGVVLLGTMLLSVMFGFAFLGGSTSPGSWQFLLPEGTGLVAGIFFVRHIRRDEAPFIPARLLYGHGFGVMNMINFVYGGAVLGLAAVVPLYAELRYGLRPLAAGTLLTSRAVGMIAVAGIASMTLRRTGSRRPMAIGFILIAFGLVLLWLPPLSALPVGPYGWLAVAAGLTGLGMGMAVPATNNATLQLAPDQVAAIAGLRGMFRQSGSIVTISATTALLATTHDPAIAQARVFLVFAVLMVMLIPLILLVPDHHGKW
jgi:EmrB/QacA subfamily drug resistance transporter